jgi:hypothetical protein
MYKQVVSESAGVEDHSSRESRDADGSDCCSFWHGCGWLGVAALAHLFVRAHDVVLTSVLGLGNARDVQAANKVGWSMDDRWHGDNRSEWELGPRHARGAQWICMQQLDAASGSGIQ